MSASCRGGSCAKVGQLAPGEKEENLALEL
jgi:hypothetical protein